MNPEIALGGVALAMAVLAVIGFVGYFRPTLYATQKIRLIQSVRLIQTVGCMAQDGPCQEGVVVGEIDREVYGARTKVTFYVVQLNNGEIKEVPVYDAFLAHDGVLEYRT